MTNNPNSNIQIPTYFYNHHTYVLILLNPIETKNKNKQNKTKHTLYNFLSTFQKLMQHFLTMVSFNEVWF